MDNWISTPNSSAIDAYCYNREQSEFYVRFRTGAEYVYFDVTSQAVRKFEQAESKGRALREHMMITFNSRRI